MDVFYFERVIPVKVWLKVEQSVVDTEGTYFDVRMLPLDVHMTSPLQGVEVLSAKVENP